MKNFTDNLKQINMSSTVHSVIFEKSYWTTQDARRELNKMGLKPIKHVDITKNYLRYRFVDPREFDHFITKNTNKHMKLVIGFY